MDKNSLIKMLEQTLEKTETKSCESCGAEFSCGAKSEKCWCFNVDLSAQTLSELQKDFNNCLCRACLFELNRTAENSAETIK
jgi:hypothetical protein